jgi:hypothetical protein
LKQDEEFSTRVASGSFSFLIFPKQERGFSNSCEAGYLDSTLKRVDVAYSAVLEEAMNNLGSKSRDI